MSLQKVSQLQLRPHTFALATPPPSLPGSRPCHAMVYTVASQSSTNTDFLPAFTAPPSLVVGTVDCEREKAAKSAIGAPTKHTFCPNTPNCRRNCLCCRWPSDQWHCSDSAGRIPPTSQIFAGPGFVGGMRC